MTLKTTPNTRLWDFLKMEVVPYKEPLPMMWVKFLSKKGFQKSPIAEGINKYLGSLGYTGSFSQRWAEWYNSSFVQGGGASAFAPYPAPAGMRWDFVTENAVRVTEQNIPVVDLVRTA